MDDREFTRITKIADQNFLQSLKEMPDLPDKPEYGPDGYEKRKPSGVDPGTKYNIHADREGGIILSEKPTDFCDKCIPNFLIATKAIRGLERLTAENADLRAKLEAAERYLAEANEAIGNLHHEVAEAIEKRDEWMAEHDAAVADLAAMTKERDAAMVRIAELELELEECGASWRKFRTDLAAERALNARLREALGLAYGYLNHVMPGDVITEQLRQTLALSHTDAAKRQAAMEAALRDALAAYRDYQRFLPQICSDISTAAASNLTCRIKLGP